MKYCTKCGTPLPDEAKHCSSCGAPQEIYTSSESYVQPKTVQPQVTTAPNFQNTASEKTTSDLKTAAKVFMIIGTVIMSLSGWLIPLAWCLPMTLKYCNDIKEGKPIGVGFKICSLLFVNLIAGILMLCDKDI